jgi:hypothetical protein
LSGYLWLAAPLAPSLLPLHHAIEIQSGAFCDVFWMACLYLRKLAAKGKRRTKNKSYGMIIFVNHFGGIEFHAEIILLLQFKFCLNSYPRYLEIFT